MSWRTEVRNQINRAKSRRAENKITSDIVKSNRELHEKEQVQIDYFRKSLSHDYTY